MERLTEDSVVGGAYIKRCASDCPYDGEYCGTDECPVLKAVANKLGQYESAEEDGLLIRLKCKVGDPVFIVVGKDISRQRIIEIRFSHKGTYFVTSRRTFHISYFGRTVFLTRKDAAEKLEEINNGKIN